MRSKARFGDTLGYPDSDSMWCNLPELHYRTVLSFYFGGEKEDFSSIV